MCTLDGVGVFLGACAKGLGKYGVPYVPVHSPTLTRFTADGTLYMYIHNPLSQYTHTHIYITVRHRPLHYQWKRTLKVCVWVIIRYPNDKRIRRRYPLLRVYLV